MAVNRVFLSAILLTCGLFASAPALAGGLLSNMVCDVNGRINIVERSLRSGNAVESADGVLVLNPTVFYNLPQVAANYEFGDACLTASGQSHDSCDVITYLRRHDLIFYSDLEQLQSYFEDRASAEKDRNIRNTYYQRIKEIYGCF